ncbi:MAG: SGNH/GDSL hydrolase family protein [Polyangiaceae bacterium]|nr:SGNH/GDSL hydrolase family protein [Polyangiaceae bacterium]
MNQPLDRSKRIRRIVLRAVLVLVLLDQLLCWTLATRPAGAIGRFIRVTGRETPPYYELKPQLEEHYESWGKGNVSSVRVNPLGFRGKEHEVNKGVGVKRVVIAGDSIAFGIGVDDGQSFPAKLEDLARETGQSNVEVWNAGVPGYAMLDLLGDLERRLLGLKPDLVILQLSRNDSAVPMPLSDFFLKLIRFSGWARVWMIYRFNFVEDEAAFINAFERYVEACEKAGVKLIVAYEGIPNASRTKVLETLKNKGITAVEIGGDAYPKLPDDPHYNVEGNKNVAVRLWGEVERELTLTK